MTTQFRWLSRAGARLWTVGLLVGVVVAVSPPAFGIHVYIMSSGNAALDADVQSLLAAHGHTSTLGPQWFQFNGSQSLADVDAVYLQMNHNRDASPDMPHLGQKALRDWVEAGGGLVTGSWAQQLAAQGSLLALRNIFPAEPSFEATTEPEATYEQIVADPILNAGLPATFTFPTDEIGGTEGWLEADPWALLAEGPSSISFYASRALHAGVMAGPAGSGWVIQFSTTMGSNQVADPNFGRLLVNSLVWVSSSHPALPDAWCSCGLAPCACEGPGGPMHVHIMSSGEPRLDSAVQALLSVYGHSSRLGAAWWEFDGSELTPDVDVVYLQLNYNICGDGQCAEADMPAGGQAALRDWVLGGGGLVTAEWTLKMAARSKMATLQTIFPADPSDLDFADRWQRFTETMPDSILTSGLPTSFTFPVDRINGGSVVDCLPDLSQPEATGYYETEIGGILSYGLVAGPAGAGRVVNLGSVVGPHQLADAHFGRLLVNAMSWASFGSGSTCICEHDGNGQVDVFDLLAYLDLWFEQDQAADLDGAAGVDVFDLLTFLDCWFEGC